MAKHCQNELCANEAAGQLPVLLTGPGGPKRALCAVCQQAYAWGVQDSRQSSGPARLWVLAVSDIGLVVHSGAFRTRRKAVQGLAQYLRVYQGYRGPAEMPRISDWLAEQAPDLGVDIFPAPLHAG